MTAAASTATVMRQSTPPGLGSRLLGLGSVFGKTFRDSRRTAFVLGLVVAMIVIVTAVSLAQEFNTVEKRLAFAGQLGGLPPIFQGMLGEMVNIDRLGGFLSWRVINFMPLILGIWSVVALSGLLAGELNRGSLDLLATTPRTRARLAVEKVGGYLLALVVTMVLFAVGTEVAILAFGSLPGDTVDARQLIGHTVWLAVMTLTPGALAFAVAPLLGRGGALAVGGIGLFASFMINAYAGSIPSLESLEPISYFSLTVHHRPLAGVEDWGAVGVLAAVNLVFLAVGLFLFARRDMLVPTGGRFQPPSIGVFLRGPFSRSFGERLPAAVIWGTGLALFGAIIAGSVDEFVKALGSIPQILQMIRQVFPDADITTAPGFLQLAFFSEAILFVSVATALIVAGWSSDEGERRLELVLGAPLTRMGWALRSGFAVMVAIGVMTALFIAGVIGAAASQAAGGDLAAVAGGVAVLGLYAMALAGVGLAVGGLVRPNLAAPVTLVLAIGFFLLELIGSIAKFPDWVLDLALSRHLGRPMLGDFDWPGMIVCALLSIGGVLVCAIGMRRRDIGR
ncbi:MAG TPA: ABC transporter permease subunit [Candidatus Limnocylindrales bacterium]|nr:ABC transporter permease subunit [Candidatus Limnocylindrales bacterium]